MSVKYAERKARENENVTRLLKSILQIIKTADSVGVDYVTNKIEKMLVLESCDIRKKSIKIIIDEVCRFYKITELMLLKGTDHEYSSPRMITYYLLYEHANMTKKDICAYFDRCYTWVNNKIIDFKNLSELVKADKVIIEEYDKIFLRVIGRIAEIKPEIKD